MTESREPSLKKDLLPGQIIAILGDKIYPIVGPKENSPLAKNKTPDATTIYGENGSEYSVEVSGHTEKAATLKFLETKDGLMINFATKELLRGAETAFSELTLIHIK